MTLPDTGPYVAAALLCERVLQEADGTVSIIRMVDRVNVNVTVGAPGARAIAGMPPVAMPPIMVSNLTLFVSFRAGAARGRSTVIIRLVQPNAVRLLEQQASILFDGDEDRGANLIMPLQVQLQMEGIYWFEILLEDQLVSRVPFRVVYLRQGLTL